MSQSRSYIIILLMAFILIISILFFPINKISYINDGHGVIRLTRIDRQSSLFHYGTFFTPGMCTNKFVKPTVYISPGYVSISPLSDGCFEILFRFKGDTTLVYPAAKTLTQNLDEKFQLIELNNGFGEENWTKIYYDDTGEYMHVTCRLD